MVTCNNLKKWCQQCFRLHPPKLTPFCIEFILTILSTISLTIGSKSSITSTCLGYKYAVFFNLSDSVLSSKLTPQISSYSFLVTTDGSTVEQIDVVDFLEVAELVTAGLVNAATTDAALLRTAARAAVLVEGIVPLNFIFCV